MGRSASRPLHRGWRSAALFAVIAMVPGEAALRAQAPAAQSDIRFDPAAFFTGRTTSEGTLTQIFASDKATRVSTFGTRQRSGEMVLDQQVQIGDQPVRNRTWRLRETAPGRFAGTISDASTDLTGTLSGDTLTLTYTMDNNLGVHQVITVNAGGQSARNVMRIRRFGITVARLTETIRRGD